MLVKSIIREIQLLPLSQRFIIVEQTLKSIKKEELNNSKNVISSKNIEEKKFDKTSVFINNLSLSKEWLSEEDKRWDDLL